MEGFVECWADFGDLVHGKLLRRGAELLISAGTSHVFVFSGQKKRVKSILQFDSPVMSLALRYDQPCLYALCENNGLYCTPLSSEDSSPSLSEQQCDDPALSTVSKDSVIIKGQKVHSFIIAKDILVTVILQEGFWSFVLYEVPECLGVSSVHHKYASFQIPAVAVKVPQNTVDASEIGGAISSAPALTCIYPWKDSSSKGHTHQHHPLLEPLLFRLLFGVDAALIHSPIILCGLPDGRLFYFPLLLPALTRSKGEQRPRIRMLYNLEQPVTFIGTSNTGQQGPQCLVVVGKMGKILLARAVYIEKETDCSFVEHTVQGPVACACVDAERLYYSTSTHLLAVPLSKTSATSSSPQTSAAEGERPFSQSSICLNVCRVIALAMPHSTPTGCVELLALSLSGRLLKVTLPEGSDKDSTSKLPASQVGQRVKDLLAGIGNVWERASSLKHQLQLKNNTLKHLNQVLNICNLLVTCQKNGQDCKPPISCHGMAKWLALLQRDTLLLTCILENSSACALAQGWTLCIELQSSFALTAAGTSRTYSFALKKLDCGQQQEVTIPLEISGDILLPIKVRCFLVYFIQSLLYTEEPRNLSASDRLASDKGCISLPLNTFTLDYLDCLRIGGTTSSCGIPKQVTSWEATHMFLSSRQISTEDEPVPNAGLHAVAIHISSELLRTTLNVQDSGSAVLCIAVLKWLVPGTLQAVRQKVQAPTVCACSPEGHAVRLLAKEVVLSDISSEGPLSVVEVLVESSSLTAVCGLHHAVLQRAQALLKDATLKHKNPPLLKGQHLCEAVQHVESLYKDLQDWRVPDAFGGVMKTRKISESLLNLYLQLREKPLVIL